jgi:hypothetical protein
MLCSEIQQLLRPLQANSTNSPPLPLVSHWENVGKFGKNYCVASNAIIIIQLFYQQITFQIWHPKTSSLDTTKNRKFAAGINVL